jgi:flagellar hook-associated protein 2
MATTTSLGIGTGVDLQSMLSTILTAEKAPIAALETKISAANTKISLYGTLQSKLDALRTAADTLQLPSRLSAISASSSDSTSVSASAIYTASVGSYSAQVTRLASAQKSFTNPYTAATTFTPGTGGTLDFTVGGVTKSIALNETTSYTLQEIGAEINSAKIGVTATVVTMSNNEQRMVLTGDKTGSGNGFQVSASGGLASLANFDLLTPEEEAAAALGTPTDTLLRSDAQDALMKIDGIEVSSSTNIFNNVNGLTLTAVKLGTANISVQNDNTKIVAATQAFVDSYNAVATLIRSNVGYNSATKTAQAFNGDSAIRSVLDTLGSARSNTPADLSTAAIKSLGALGITVQQSGLLAIDATKLNAAISTSATNVIQTLSAYGKSFSTAVSTMQGSEGVVLGRLNNLNSSVTRFRDNQEKLEVRVALVEKRYRAQFIALDKLMSTMKVTSSSLEQQLAGLTSAR